LTRAGRPRHTRIAAHACMLTCAAAAQIVNTGEELLQLTVVLSRPPIRVFVYDAWDAPDASAAPRVPYLFDQECQQAAPLPLEAQDEGATRDEELH
jgi:hypothetical protein